MNTYKVYDARGNNVGIVVADNEVKAVEVAQKLVARNVQVLNAVEV